MKQGFSGSLKLNKLNYVIYCVLGKQCRVKFESDMHNSTRLFGYVHSNLRGSARVVTHGRDLYFLTIIDDFSR